MTITDRILANQILLRVIQEGASLTEVFQTTSWQGMNQAFVKELCFGVLRYYERLEFYLAQLLTKPLKAKDQALKVWLLLGLYQLIFMKIPAHAVVNEMVNQTAKISHERFKSLVNAILRNYLRNRDGLEFALTKNPSAYWCLPTWLLNKIQKDWPQDWQSIAKSLQQQAPMTLRINRLKINFDLVEQLKALGEPIAFVPRALTLTKPMPVDEIPGFNAGLVTVQDAGAQLAAYLLAVKDGQQVLDACAAPGGKTTHILELAQVKLTALDISAKRLTLVQQNLQRLGLSAEILAKDIKTFAQDCPAAIFDRILLDVPCSAIGVINRHPDIKQHRKLEDLIALQQEQRAILKAVWPLLKPNGIMLYSTCSILRMENEQQIQDFLASHSDAVIEPIDLPVGQACRLGWQLLPTNKVHDGFYYCKIRKQPPK